MTDSSKIREYVRREYVEPALSRGEGEIRVRVGDVHRQMAMKNRVPLVCQALQSEIFLKENNLILEKKEGPPSGLSTSVVLTYRPSRMPKDDRPRERFAGLLRLKGIGKEVFASLGGGENFLRKEREEFIDAFDKIEMERARK